MLKSIIWKLFQLRLFMQFMVPFSNGRFLAQSCLMSFKKMRFLAWENSTSCRFLILGHQLVVSYRAVSYNRILRVSRISNESHNSPTRQN